MKKNTLKHALLAACGILFFGLVAFFSSVPKTLVKVDLTKEKIHTLSRASIDIIESAKKNKEKIDVYAFFANDGLGGRFSEILNLYQSKGAPLLVHKFDPKTATSEAQKYDVDTNANVVIFASMQKKERVEIINEEKITNAIAKVIHPKKSRKILVAAGQGETPMSSSKGSGFAKYLKVLTESGYALEEKVLSNLSAKELLAYQIVVILDPKMDYSKSMVQNIELYAASGGSVYLSLGAWKELPNLQDWVATKGVLINNDALILNPNDSRAKKYGTGNAVLSKLNATNRVSRFLGASGAKYGVLLPDTRSLSLLQPKDRRIFREDLATSGRPTMVLPNAVSKAKRRFKSSELLDKQPLVGAFVYRNYANESVDKGQNKKFKMFVLGSSVFANNIGYQNPILRELFLNSMAFLSNSEDFIAIAAPKELDSQIDLTSQNSTYALNFIMYLYPLLILGAGIASWWRRMQR